MTDKILHMIGNAHLDPVWLWQWQEGFQEVKATFRSALDRMNEYPEFVFTSSSAAYYEWVEHNHPAMFEEIRTRIAEGRWVICGGWWIQPDCNLPNGESFVRQGLYGQHYFKEKFGVTAKVGYNVDSFGHHAMIPQLLKKSGMDYYVFMRPEAHEREFPTHTFWWESDDGSKVLAYRLPYAYNTFADNLTDKLKNFAEEAEDEFNQQLMCFYGVGNHGGGPTKANLDSIRQLQTQPGQTQFLFSSPNQFFEGLSKDVPYPVLHDDLQHTASGCYAAHSGVKKWNRQAENLLAMAEKFAAVALSATNQPYPDLSQAWKAVLFNQFHDILAGTSLPEAYEDARDLYGEAKSIAARGLNYAVQSLAWSIGISEEEGMTPIVVFNPNAWPVQSPISLEFGHPGWVGDSMLKGTELLVDDHGKRVSFQAVQSHTNVDFRSRIAFVADLPPLGYRVYRMYRTGAALETASPDSMHATDTVLENARFRLELDPVSGCIASLYDKRACVEVFSGPAARPVVVEDKSNTWSHNVFHFHDDIGAFQATRVKLVSHGPVQSVIRVESTYGQSLLMQEFTLYADLDRIDVEVTVDWREQFKLLKLQFPVGLQNAVGTYEIPYGHIERPLNGEEEPGISWIDMSGKTEAGEAYGVSLLNDGKYSFDMREGLMSLTILRSPMYAYYYHFAPFEPKDHEKYAFLDQGEQQFRYTLIPHEGTWKEAGTVRLANELNQLPFPLLETYHNGVLPQSNSFLSVDEKNVLVSVFKQAEDGDGFILRCYETDKIMTLTHIRIPLLNRLIETELGPCEIKTFRIPTDPTLPVVETNLLEWPE